jgi:PhnB protein
MRQPFQEWWHGAKRAPLPPLRKKTHRTKIEHSNHPPPKEQAMQITPYLFYNGNCEAAFKFYEKALGGKIDAMLTHEGAPASMQVPPEWKMKIMHAKITIDGEIILASDASPGDFHQPQGFAVSLSIDDPADAERKFNALCQGGVVNMAFAKTFFSRGFGMCVDQFGIPWMVHCPIEE